MTFAVGPGAGAEDFAAGAVAGELGSVAGDCGAPCAGSAGFGAGACAGGAGGMGPSCAATDPDNASPAAASSATWPSVRGALIQRLTAKVIIKCPMDRDVNVRDAGPRKQDVSRTIGPLARAAGRETEAMRVKPGVISPAVYD
jgi:hypothetical protein